MSLRFSSSPPHRFPSLELVSSSHRPRMDRSCFHLAMFGTCSALSPSPPALTIVSTCKVNLLTELCPLFPSGSLPADDHPSSRHGPWMAQRDREGDQHGARICA